MTYGGQAHFVSLDKENWTAVIEGSGKETKGTGTAKGLVTAKLTSEAPDRTRVDVNTDVQITGKAAQFGRGDSGCGWSHHRPVREQPRRHNDRIGCGCRRCGR